MLSASLVACGDNAAPLLDGQPSVTELSGPPLSAKAAGEFVALDFGASVELYRLEAEGELVLHTTIERNIELEGMSLGLNTLVIADYRRVSSSTVTEVYRFDGDSWQFGGTLEGRFASAAEDIALTWTSDGALHTHVYEDGAWKKKHVSSVPDGASRIAESPAVTNGTHAAYFTQTVLAQEPFAEFSLWTGTLGDESWEFESQPLLKLYPVDNEAPSLNIAMAATTMLAGGETFSIGASAWERSNAPKYTDCWNVSDTSDSLAIHLGCSGGNNSEFYARVFGRDDESTWSFRGGLPRLPESPRSSRVYALAGESTVYVIYKTADHSWKIAAFPVSSGL